jgi:hypothetical protein
MVCHLTGLVTRSDHKWSAAALRSDAAIELQVRKAAWTTADTGWHFVLETFPQK